MEVVEAVFYKEGTRLKASRGELSVSAPCAVLIDKDKLSVTDATMNPDCKEIIVDYGGKRITVAMPQRDVVRQICDGEFIDNE